MRFDPDQFRQAWEMPTRPRPIVLIGAGGIVRDAHLPAYKKAGFKVSGLFDVNREHADALAKQFSIDRVFGSMHEAAAADAVFDVAVPPEFEFDVLSQLPDRAVVLMQKPMGTDIADARRIRDLCRAKNFTASVNFQLRFSPMMLVVRDAINRGLLGKLVDVEFHLNIRTPWELFPFVKKLKRAEILVHTVHHLDFCRSLLGEPTGVYARTLQHPSFPDFQSTKTSVILNYGNMTRCVLSINHNYEFGPTHEAADVSIQGTEGALRVSLGLLMDYPHGKPETVELATKEQPWTQLKVDGRWFPDGFIGTMSNLQRFAVREDEKLVTSFEDAFQTMAVVEACYQSDATGGTPVPQ